MDFDRQSDSGLQGAGPMESEERASKLFSLKQMGNEETERISLSNLCLVNSEDGDAALGEIKEIR